VQVVIKGSGVASLSPNERETLSTIIQRECAAAPEDGQGIADVYFVDSGDNPHASPSEHTEQQVLLMALNIVSAFSMTRAPMPALRGMPAVNVDNRNQPA
jgi:hypothetical protein